MQKIRLLLLMVVGGLLMSFGVHAEGENIVVSGAWARPVLVAGRPGAVYFDLHNQTNMPEQLLAVSTPLAGRAELHVHKMENGVMKMRQVAAVEIPAGGRLTFQPGGYHVMIFDVKDKLLPGQKLPLTLTFEKHAQVTLEAEVMMNQPAASEAQGITPLPHQDGHHKHH
tara:strand:+ start:2205 stop:2711 length:507 start_codon:yes stop_codon:yes gene_type:complete